MIRYNTHLSFDLSQPVRVYYNLHKHCLSILAKSNKGYRLWCHTTVDTILTLCDITFKIYEQGRKRVLRERVKNVHAYIIGYIKDQCDNIETQKYGLRYNPYEAGYFTLNGKRADEVLDRIIIKGNGIYIPKK